jgi:hypothetical protein
MPLQVCGFEKVRFFIAGLLAWAFKKVVPTSTHPIR